VVALMPRRCLALVPLLTVAACARAQPLVRVRDVRTAMGTYMAITVYAPSEATGREAIAAAFQRVEHTEAIISTWRSKSDISRLNRAAGGPPITIHPQLFALLTRSLGVWKETGGAFDVTAGPLIRIWKRAIRLRTLPPEDVVAEARALVGSGSLRLAPERHQAQLLKKRMHVDLGAIGKGYIIDQAIEALRGQGIDIALVDAGGDVFALGKPPGRPGWLIGVRDPEKPSRILPRPLLVTDCAAATSGDYEQFVVIDGRRYSHIVDPRTGHPAEGVCSVSLIAPDAATADAYATAATVLGAEAAVAFAERHAGVEVLVLHRRDGKVVRAQSSGFAAYESEPSK